MDGRDPMISAFHVRPGLPNLLTRDWVTLNYTLSISYSRLTLTVGRTRNDEIYPSYGS